MRIAQFCVLGMLLLVFPFASMAGSGGSPPETESDASAGSTKTHIKYTPFDGLTKIEMPELRLPGMPKSSEQDKKFGVFNVFNILRVVWFKDYPQEAACFRLLEVPFMNAMEFGTVYESIYKSLYEDTEADESDSEDDGLVIRFEAHQPLFCLFYGFYAYDHAEPDQEEGDQSEHMTLLASNVKVLDSLVFCLGKRSEWREKDMPPDEWAYRAEWFELPWSTTYEHGETANSSLYRILDVPLATGFLYDKEGQREKTRLLDLPISSLYRQDAWEGGGKSAVLETPTIMFDWTTAALWRKERMEDETVCHQFVRLPLIGPIWSVWNDPQDGGRKTALLPRLLFWKYPAFAR